MFFKRTRNKFNAQRTGSFPSKLEASVYKHLLLFEKAGEIKDIRRQEVVYLTDAKISWKLDFSYIRRADGEKIWAEAKGIETNDYLLKKKLWSFYGPGPLEIWKGNYKRPSIHELIVPKHNNKGES